MVSADHSSSFLTTEGKEYAGEAAGFVIRTPEFSIYHAGDTNVFTDMKIIDYLYNPNLILLPIGGLGTMGPREAAFATAKLFKRAKTVIPMHFGTFSILPGTIEEFEKHLAKFSTEFGRAEITVVDPHVCWNAAIPLP